MNGTQIDSLGGQEASIFKLFAQGLKDHPAYLLILGIIFLTLLLCIHAYTFGVSDPYLKQMGLGALAIESIMAFLLIRSVEAGKSRQRIIELEHQAATLRGRADSAENALKVADIIDINLPNEAMRKHIASAIDNTRKALEIPNHAFHEEIKSAIENFVKDTGEWSNGHLTTDSFNYERIILKFYSLATKSVFATSNEYYMSFWANSEKAKKIIEAHKKAYDGSGAIVERVFIFATKANITAEHIEIIARQENLPFIRTKILIVDEHDSVRLAPHLLKDFVIIDEDLPTQAIGIESSVDLSSIGARWVFRPDPNTEGTAQWMSQMSVSLEELKSRLDHRT